jgi:hypothetical protein
MKTEKMSSEKRQNVNGTIKRPNEKGIVKRPNENKINENAK